MRKTAKELTQQYAEKQFKVAADMSTETDDQRSSPIQSNDIVDMNSIGGALADYFAPAAWGGERAGRAQIMAESSGQKTPFNVRHPLTTSFVPQVTGGVIGGTLGGIGGYNLVDSYLASRRQNNLFNSTYDNLFPTGGRTAIGTGGAIAGSVVGTLLGTALTGLLRRKQMATIGKGYDESLANGTMSLKPTKFNRASTALLPFRGAHRAGQNDAYKAISSNKPVSEVRPRLRDLGYATTAAIGPIAAMTPLAPISAPLAHAAQLSQQLGMNYHTQFEQDVRNKARKEKSTKEASLETDDQRSSPIQSNDIVDMNSIGGALADYFAPAAWGGERAGRAQIMAEAAGKKAPLNVRHPLATSFVPQVAAGTAGSLLGGIGAYTAVDSYLKNRQSNNLFNSTYDRLFPSGGRTDISVGGAIAGGVAGAMLGTALTGLLRRKQMANIGKAYDESVDDGTMSLKPTRFNEVSTALLPFRGAHRAGQNDAYKAISSNKPVSQVRPRSRDLGYAASMAVGPVAAMTPLAPVSGLLSNGLQLGQQYGMNYHTQLEQDRRNKADKAKSTNESGKKEASFDINQILANAQKMVQPAVDQAGVVGKYISKGLSNPETRTMTAAGLGAGLGAFNGIAEARQPHENRFSKIIRDTLYGGAIGAGGALLYTQLQNRPRGVFRITGNSFGKVGNLITDNLGNLVQSAGDVQGKAMTGVPGLLSGAKDYLAQAGNSPARAGLVGAGVGAGLGLLGGMRRPKKERSLMSDAMIGAAAGGAAGVGLPRLLSMYRSAGRSPVTSEAAASLRKQVEDAVAAETSPLFSEGTIGGTLTGMANRPLTTMAGALGLGGAASGLTHAVRNGGVDLGPISRLTNSLGMPEVSARLSVLNSRNFDPSYWLKRVTPDELVDNLATMADKLHPSESRATLLREIASAAKQSPEITNRLYNAGLAGVVPENLINDIATRMPAGNNVHDIFNTVDSTLTGTTLRNAAQAERSVLSPFFGRWSGFARNPMSKLRLGRAGLIGGGALLAADALLPTMTDRSTTSLFTGVKP